MSKLEDLTNGTVASTIRNGRTMPRHGWAMLRYGWPALLLCAGFVWAQVVQPLGSPEAGAVFALSPAPLAEGRWWTVLTHMFSSGLSGFFLAIATFIAGCTAVATRDPDWMGGWRTPVMFVGCGLVGALVHLLTAGGAPLLSSWPAVLGLLAFWLASGRRPTWESSGSPTEKAEPETWLKRGLDAGWTWLFPWVLFGFGGAAAWGIHLPFGLTPSAGLVVGVVGAAVMFGLTTLGGFAARVALLAQLVVWVALTGVLLVKGLSVIDIDTPLVVATLGSLVFGGLLGLGSKPVAQA